VLWVVVDADDEGDFIFFFTAADADAVVGRGNPFAYCGGLHSPFGARRRLFLLWSARSCSLRRFDLPIASCFP
jgi:hypothetical protein